MKEELKKEQLEKEQLRAQYLELYGKSAPPKAGENFLKRKIDEKLQELNPKEEKAEVQEAPQVVEETKPKEEFTDSEFTHNGEKFPYRKGRKYAVIKKGCVVYLTEPQAKTIYQSDLRGSDWPKQWGFEGFPEGNNFSFQVKGCKNCGK